MEQRVLHTEFDPASLDIVPLEDEGLAVSSDCGVIIHLNAVGRQVLEAFMSGLTIDELAKDIADGYGISCAQARADLVRFRDDLGQSIHAAQHQATGRQVEPPALSSPVTEGHYLIFERIVRISYFDQRTAAVCHPPLAPFLCEAASADHLNVEITQSPDEITVCCGQATVSIENIAGGLMTALQRAILCHDVSNPGPFGVVLHAGAIVGTRGAWLIGGASGRGKSTLVARLDAEGFRILSDDLVPVDLASCRAFPMPTAISVKEKGWATVSEFREDIAAAPICTSQVGKKVKYLRPHNPPGDADRAGHPIAGVLLPEFTAGASPQIEQIGLKQTMIGLCDRFGRFPVETSDVRHLIGRLEHLPRHRLVYGDGEKIMPQLCDLL